MKRDRKQGSIRRAFALLSRTCMANGHYTELFNALESADPGLARRHLAAAGNSVEAAGAHLGMKASNDSKLGATVLDEYLFGDPTKALTMVATLNDLLGPRTGP